MKWYVVDCLLQLAFMLLNPFRLRRNWSLLICSAFLYILYPNFLHDLTQCQMPSFQSGLAEIIFCYSFPPSIQLDRIEILPLLFLWICLFHNFSQISHLSFYCSMCCSSALAMCSLQVSGRHVLSPRKQALNSNSTFISLIMLLLTSDLRAGFHVVSYPT